VKVERQQTIAQNLIAAQTERAKQKGFEIWKVVHEPHVVAREEPSTAAQSTGILQAGQELIVTHRKGDWARIVTDEQLWEVEYSQDTAETQRAFWVLIDGASLGLGPLLECVYLPPSRVAYLTAAERVVNSVVADGAASIRVRRCRRGSHGHRFTYVPKVRQYRQPGAARRHQLARARWRKFYADLLELSEKDQQNRLSELGRQERARFKQWWAQERKRWQACATELRQLTSTQRQAAIARMSTEHRACLHAVIEEQRRVVEAEQCNPRRLEFSFDKKTRSKSMPCRARNR